MRTFTCHSPESVTKVCRGAGDHKFALYNDINELVAYNLVNHSQRFGLQAQDWARKADKGDLSYVPRSERYMKRYEETRIATVSRQWDNSLCGPIPNVPAFVAGHPLDMRNRRKTLTAQGPIAVVFDAFPGSGVDAETMAKIGAAILAFVRILATQRSVELWIGGTLEGSKRGGAWTFTRMDTAPLDLAHVAYALCAEHFGRHLSAATLYGNFEDFVRGGWPYADQAVCRAYMADTCRPAFPHVTELLAIPAIHPYDPLQQDPEKWLDDMLAKHIESDLTSL